MATVYSLVNERAQQNPNKVFLTAAETGRELEFAQLCQYAEQVNTVLNRLNVARGATVGFLMDNGYWTTALFLGIMYSGRVVLPLNAVAGPDQIDYVLSHSDVQVVFVCATYAEKFSDVIARYAARIQFIDSCEDNGPDRLMCPEFDQPVQASAQDMDSDETALMIYTSGTTGRPKGVLLSHKNVVAGGRNTMLAHDLTDQDISLCVLPLYHINAEMVSVMAPLVSNSEVVMSRRLSITNFWSWIETHGCTWFSAVPTIISYLIEQRQRDDKAIAQGDSSVRAQQPDFTKIEAQVRFGRSASAALSPATHQLFETLFSIPIVETMGISECAAQILSNPMVRGENQYGSPGIAVGNEIRIVDQSHQTLPAGEKGEIAVRGDNIMKGYYKNPEATAEALDDEGWFYTGDLGYMDDGGFVFVTGRSKELIIKGGENVAPREIDDVLYKHPAVLEAAAFGIPDPHYGQEIMASVAIKPGHECDAGTLLDHCLGLLGKYKTPKSIEVLDELPKGPSGKIQRLKLADRFSD